MEEKTSCKDYIKVKKSTNSQQKDFYYSGSNTFLRVFNELSGENPFKIYQIGRF